MPAGLPRPKKTTRLNNLPSDIYQIQTEDMQCPIMLGREQNSGNVKMKTVNSFKNPYEKEPTTDFIIDNFCTRLQDQRTSQVGMPTCSIEQTEAVRRYYAAFPALKKGRESPLQYYLPPPAWCRKTHIDINIKMQSALPVSKELNIKPKKYTSGKERRNSYQGQKRNSRKRYNSYSRSFESQESLPEWVTHEGVWDMETQDPVKEFIRAIALDEGYGTCENTVTDELKEITEVKLSKMNENMVPDWDDSLDLDTEWVINEDISCEKEMTPMEEELYAKFEAKFDHSIEALWSKDQNTPDDEYQELPIDFQDLLSSPSDNMFADPSIEKTSLVTLAESVWSNEATDGNRSERAESSSRIVEVLHDRFKPLNLADAAEPVCPRELDAFALYEGEEIYDALSSVAQTMRSYTAINHSRDRSGFVEVPPRRRSRANAPVAPKPQAVADAPALESREDLLVSNRTHFKPIRHEGEVEVTRYADGDTFDINGELDEVEFHRSESGGVYSKTTLERYLEYRGMKTIDYGRLNLTAAQRCPDLDDNGFRLRFLLRQRDAGVQTDMVEEWGGCECGQVAKKMRPSAVDAGGIWTVVCRACAPVNVASAVSASGDEGERGGDGDAEWEELLSDISAAHARYAGGGGGGGGGGEVEEAADRKRRHSAARCGTSKCPHPHARFLHCCTASLDRPLTR